MHIVPPFRGGLALKESGHRFVADAGRAMRRGPSAAYFDGAITVFKDRLYQSTVDVTLSFSPPQSSTSSFHVSHRL